MPKAASATAKVAKILVETLRIGPGGGEASI
jgi:hypothetical protein